MKTLQKYKSPAVGYSLSRTTCDNGCGIQQDKRTKRQRTRQQQRLVWKKDHLR